MLHCATLRDSASNTNTNRTELNWICLCGCTMMATHKHTNTPTTQTRSYPPLDNNKDGYENNANSFHNGIGESTTSVDHVHVVVGVVGLSQVKI